MSDKIAVHDTDTNKIEHWTLEEVIDYINADRSEDWSDYDEGDWREGWREWVDPDYYTLVEQTGVTT